MDLNPKVAQANEIDELRKLSTERLIIWIVGRSKEISLKLTPEEMNRVREALAKRLGI